MKLPQFKPRDLGALIRRAGFERTHDSGGHRYFRNWSTKRTTCIPQHGGDVDPRLARKILFQDCQLTRHDVQRLLHGK